MRAQNFDGAVTNSEIDSNVQETITEVIEEDVNAFMSDDGNAGDKEVEIQIFDQEEDSHSEISEEDEAVAATQGDESYPYEVEDSPPLDESDDRKGEGQPQELFQRFHQNLKHFLPCRLPRKPKSIKEYLNGIFEGKDCMNEKRLEILGRCGSSTSLQDTKLRALVVSSFPVVPVGSRVGKNIPITFVGDSFPQFSQKEKSNFFARYVYHFRSGPWKTANHMQN